MSISTVVPGPRSALDEGSVHDLCVDGAQIVLPGQPAQDGTPARPGHGPVVVPDDASALLADLPPYGT